MVKVPNRLYRDATRPVLYRNVLTPEFRNICKVCPINNVFGIFVILLSLLPGYYKSFNFIELSKSLSNNFYSTKVRKI